MNIYNEWGDFICKRKGNETNLESVAKRKLMQKEKVTLIL